MGLVLVTPPAVEPVTLAEAKDHLRVTGTDEDTLIGAYVAAAREWAEGFTRRAFVTQTWELRLDAFPARGSIRLRKPPVQAITSVVYVDANGAEQTVAATGYVLSTADFPGSVRLAYGAAWPTARDEGEAVRVRFTAGYGLAAAVPAAIKAAVLLQIGTLYAQREGLIAGTIVAKNPTAEALLAPYVYREVP